MWIETRLSRIVLNMRMPNKESILRYYSKSFKISMLPIVILCPLYRAYIYISFSAMDKCEVASPGL